MRFYLASRHSRKAELRGHRELLAALGHEVTSRWLDGDYPTGADGKSLVADDATRARVASEDMDDVLAADVLIAFTEPSRSDGRGGRHCEFGIALATGRRLVVVGEAENVFYMHPRVERYEAWTDFLDAWFPLRAGNAASCR